MGKKDKNDEFYTPSKTIIDELKYYGYDGLFKDKTIYLPCDYDATLPYIKKEIKQVEWECLGTKLHDDVVIYKVMPELFTEEEKYNGPRNCQFVAYLTEHKKDFGIKDIYISGYDALSKKGLRFQDSPFNCFDIIITNPPFSQMQEWIEKIIEFKNNGGSFLFLAPLSILTNTFAFQYFKNNDFWCGYTEPSKYEDSHGNIINSYLPSVWLTNFDVKKHKRKRPLSKSWHDHPDEFLPYWNFKGIDVKGVDDIPYDYKGIMGVPATFLKDLHTDQFEIIGWSQGKEQLQNLDGMIDWENKGYTTDMIRLNNTGGMYTKCKGTGGVASSKIVLYNSLDLKNPYKCPFCKLLIKNKEILPGREYYDYEDVVSWLRNQLQQKDVESIWNEKVYKARSNQKVKHGKGGNK